MIYGAGVGPGHSKNYSSLSKPNSNTGVGNASHILIIKVVQAKILRNTEMFGSMDPYIEIYLSDGAFFRTKVAQNQGMSP